MFEKLKKWFGGTVEMEAQPIEVNPTESKQLTRNEARLERLLTIKYPSTEVLAEITKLRELI